MSQCDTSKKAVDILDRIASGISELKRVITESPERDSETRDTNSVKAQIDAAYHRMEAGVPKSVSGNPQFPSEHWFQDIVLRVVQNELKHCKDMATSRGAHATASAIDSRSCSARY
jgi:hypothetical protein